MTAFSFVLGVIPLVVASGAGAASRRSLGTAVFSGMVAASILVPPYRVGDEYWLIVQPPIKFAAGYYHLVVTLFS